MSKLNLAIVGIILIAASLACKSFMPGKTATTSGPPIDFTTPAAGVDVKVELDKKQTASGKISPNGGSVSLTTADGSKFTLEVPANALDAETTIKMTAVKTLDGAPLDTNTPTAVQLEPSGLLFNELLTLTIVPAKEIPIEKQIIFGYEGNGEDYHLMPVDHESKEIKIRLMNFSAGGVGSASDVAWAANLMIQAQEASTRLEHWAGRYTQGDRRVQLSGEGDGDPDWHAKLAKAYDQYEDEVVRKEMVAAELDCKHAKTALHHLIGNEHNRAVIGIPEKPDFREKMAKLLKIGEECKKTSYRAEGSSGGASFKGDICSLDKPFTIDVDSITGKWPMNFTPESDSAGTMEGTFSSNGCTLTGGGPYTVSIGENGSGTITFTYNSTASCPGVPSEVTSKTTTLPLKPAPELSCP